MSDLQERINRLSWQQKRLLAKQVGAENTGKAIGQGSSHTAIVAYLVADQRIETNDLREGLKEKLVDQVLQGKVQADDTIITNARHYHALQEVLQSLTDIRSGLENSIPGDLVALDIRRCLHYLGEITGEITTEDQLDYIFSKFCIGK